VCQARVVHRLLVAAMGVSACVALALVAPGISGGRTPAAAPARAQPAYGVDHLRVIGPGQQLRGRFTPAGAVLRVGRTRVSVGLAAFGRGGALKRFAAGRPRATDNRVIYAAPDVREWFASGPWGLEQGFDVARRPRGRGTLAFAISLSGATVASLEGGRDARLTTAHGGSLAYDDVSATDARGRHLRAWLGKRAGRLSVLVDDGGARYPIVVDPLVQTAKLVGSGALGATPNQGTAAAVSSDGNTVLVGASGDNSQVGASWVFVRANGSWTQQAKLVGSPAAGAHQGYSVALSADGNTALVGGPTQAWVFTRSGTTWTQRQDLSVTNSTSFGTSVALSGDGNTALIGDPNDTSDAGAAWVYTRSGDTFISPQKLTATNETGGVSQFGSSVALSADGATALIGGPDDHGDVGAAWTYTLSAGTWTQGQKLAVGDESGAGQFGYSVALSSAGTTALIGGPFDAGDVGAAWVYANSNAAWSERAKLAAGDATGLAEQGFAVALSGDGASALVGGPDDDGNVGAAFLFTDANSSWPEQAKLHADDAVGAPEQGFAVALTDDAGDAIVGGPDDNTQAGAAWTYSTPTTTTPLSASPATPQAGHPVTLTATVTPAPNGGTVAFTGAVAPFPGCTAVAVVGNQAECQTTLTTAGNVKVSAAFSGNGPYLSSSTSTVLSVAKGSTAVTITASPNPVHAGGPVTVTATVTPTPDGGGIEFDNDTQPNPYDYAGCSLVPLVTGKATCQISPTSATPALPVDAYYPGDANFDTSEADTNLEVLAPVLDDSTIGMSIAQAAGDPAQSGPSDGTMTYRGVPLVTGRRTLVRVFADPVGITIPGSPALVATLTGSAHGEPLAGSPLASVAPSPSQVGGSFDAQLGIADTAFNFLTPSAWWKGDVTLTANVHAVSSPPSGSVTCPSACHASLTLKSVKFTKIPTFEVTPVEMTWTSQHNAGGFTDGQLVKPGDPQAAMALAYEMMPVHTIVKTGYAGTIDITSLQNDTGGLGGNTADLDGLNAVFNWAENRFTSSTGSSVGDLHDMVVGFNVGIARGDTFPDPSLGTYTTSGGKQFNVSEPTSVVNAPNSLAVAHEMGHAVGRKHADEACGGPAGGGSDTSWPDYRGHLEPTANLANGAAPSSQTTAAANSYGVNLGWRTPSASATGPIEIFPDTAYDVMSYCGNLYEPSPSAAAPGTVWASARGWQQELDCVKAHPVAGCPHNQQQPSFGEVPVSTSAAHVTAASSAGAVGGVIGGPTISFLGYVEPGGALLAPSLLPTVGGTAGPAGSPFTATLTSRRGAVIATEPLSYESMHLDPSPGHPGLALVALQGHLPTHGRSLGGLVVRNGGHVTDRILAPRRAPRVTVRTPSLRRGAKALTLRWNSHDPDKARRTVFVAVSTTGRRYTTIWEGADTGRAVIPRAQLGPAGPVRLRVSVSDGFQFSVATTRPIRLGRIASAAGARAIPAWMRDLARAGVRLVNP
jgi:hypothetical protein